MQTSSAATVPLRRNKRDIRRTLARIRLALYHASRPAALSMGMFLLTFVRWLGIPSPFAAALLLSFAGASPFLLLGLAASGALRLLWGLEGDVWQLAACGLLWAIKRVCHPKAGIETAALGGMAMMPRIVAALVAGTPLDVILSCAALPVAMLASACFRLAMDTAGELGTVPRGREQISLLWLGVLVVDGLGYFRIGPFNLGQAAALTATLAFAAFNGPVYGMTGGLMCGLSLAATGHDSRLVLPLALCGMISGTAPMKRFRWLHLPVMLLTAGISGLITGASAGSLSPWAAGLGSAVFCLLPTRLLEKAKPYLSGMDAPRKSMETAFVQSRIEHMRDAVTRLARAIPQPERDTLSAGEELGEMLCAKCANREMCWGRTRGRTEKMLNCMMELSSREEEISESSVPVLAEHGCLRAEIIPEIARDALLAHQRHSALAKKARYEHEVTMTHLTALTGTLQELEALAQGESFHDLRSAHVITLALEELQVPARLLYARRMDGHLQAALAVENMLPIQKSLEGFLRYLAQEEGIRLNVTRVQKNVVELEELPLYSATVGMASLCAGEKGEREHESVCGDALCARRCEGGRMLVMLCDGMGHGPEAHRQSEKTLELLLLLLEAGYSRRQAITAVNGIMLGTQQEERFSTVDLADVDLWTGETCAEKLGACASWVVRGSHMKKIEGASLPIGILEETAATSTQYRLHSGDILVMMSDGVADVFESDEQLRRTLEENVFIDPQRMADAILRSALLYSEGAPRDDMSVLVLLLLDRRQEEEAAEASIACQG